MMLSSCFSVIAGDIGHYDDDQFLWIVDRLKELIKYKSYQVCVALVYIYNVVLNICL